MKQKIAALLTCLPLMGGASGVLADAAADIKQLNETIEKQLPQLKGAEIRETPIAGLYEVLSDNRLLYLSPDANFMVNGDIIDLEKQANVSRDRRNGLGMAAINDMPDSKLVVFKGKDSEKPRSITVFTDTSCPYCSKLHADVEALNAAGITVRYMLYPRAGMGSPAAKTLESVFCADDPLKAMTMAKARQEIEPKTCDHPIEEHMSVANLIGLRGTPLIFLDNGQRLDGYVPSKQLIEMLENSPPAS